MHAPENLTTWKSFFILNILSWFKISQQTRDTNPTAVVDIIHGLWVGYTDQHTQHHHQQPCTNKEPVISLPTTLAWLFNRAIDG